MGLLTMARAEYWKRKHPQLWELGEHLAVVCAREAKAEGRLPEDVSDASIMLFLEQESPRFWMMLAVEHLRLVNDDGASGVVEEAWARRLVWLCYKPWEIPEHPYGDLGEHGRWPLRQRAGGDPVEASPPPPMNRECPFCAEAVPALSSYCPHCEGESEPLSWSRGYWWIQDRKRWYWLDEERLEWMSAMSSPLPRLKPPRSTGDRITAPRMNR
jgi:hypothetical protein